MAESEATNFFTQKLYDRLKFIAQIVLPALGTFWFTIGGIWGIPYTTQVVGTITALDFCLGVILGVSSNQYYKNGANFDGDVNYIKESDGAKVQFAFERDPAEIIEDEPGKHSMEFKVNRVKGTNPPL